MQGLPLQLTTMGKMLATTFSGSNGDDGEDASGCNGDKLGRKYLCISATSSASERLSGNIVILQVELH